MLKKISTIPFRGTPEQAQRLQAVIETCKDDKSQLMHVMQEAQEIYGYLPYEVQVMIAEGMDIPYEKHTEHSWVNREKGFSCEGVLANLLSDASYNDWTGTLQLSDYDTGTYAIEYTKVSGENDRTATYSYAGLSDSDFLPLPSESAASISLMSADGEDAAVTQDAVAVTSWKGTDSSVTLTITPEDGAIAVSAPLIWGKEDKMLSAVIEAACSAPSIPSIGI